MALKQFLRQYKAIPDHAERQAFAAAEVAALKERYARELRSNVAEALKTTEKIASIGEALHDDEIVALGFRTKANVLSIGFGKHPEALELYEGAEDKYRLAGNELEIARMRAAQVWPIAITKGYDAAINAGSWAYDLLETQGEWRTLGVLINNLGIVHNYYGEIHESLALYDRSKATFLKLGEDGMSRLISAESNRCLALTFLGRYQEAAAAGAWALEASAARAMTIVHARTLNNLGYCHAVQGKYTAALQDFDRALDIWSSENAHHERAQLLLTMSYCLLELRDFTGAVARCREAFELCIGHTVQPESPFDFLNETRGYLGLGKFEEALQALDRFETWLPKISQANPLTSAQISMLKAEVLLLQRNPGAARRLAQETAVVFKNMSRRVEHAGAKLLEAKAFEAEGDLVAAQRSAANALALAQVEPAVRHQVYRAAALLGHLALKQHAPDTAYRNFEIAIKALTQLKSRTMLDLRPDFMQDAEKKALFEAMVRTCLDLNEPETAFSYIERARAGALRDLLAFRIDLGIRARQPEDADEVNEFNRLVARRNTLMRKAEWHSEGLGEIEGSRFAALEQQISGLRKKLLLRNADYATSPAFETSDPAGSLMPLAPGVLLVSFFEIDRAYIALCRTLSAPHPIVIRLGAGPMAIERLMDELNLNFASARAAPPAFLPELTAFARETLLELHRLLLHPMEELVSSHNELRLVPFGKLHDVPFQALFDGERHLAESHVLSRQPSAGFGALPGDHAGNGQAMLVVGHSGRGILPFIHAEVDAVSRGRQADTLLEEAATRTAVMAGMEKHGMIHLAAHAGFHQAHPLFSGLELEDGWLTALDVFNLRLAADLVTLSGCRTGEYRLGGGEEMQGLVQAFLAAGVRSLLMSGWDVEDRSTARLMETFYEGLSAGMGKGQALQAAQVRMIRGVHAHSRHPYFWAPFYLVGDTGSDSS